MIYLLHLKMHFLGKNKTYNFRHQKSVIPVKEVDLSQDQVLIDVLIVEEMEG